MNNRHLSAIVLATVACVVAPLPGQAIEVRPFDHGHRFSGGGCATGLYGAHLTRGTSAAQRSVAYDWLFRDVENVYVRGSFNDQTEPVNDNSDPFVLDLSGIVFGNFAEGEIAREATARNPRTKVHVYAEDIPNWLRRPVANGEVLDDSNPNLYAEIAEWVFANLVDMKINHQVEVDSVDLLNEPDFRFDGSFRHTREDAKRLYANVPPLLQRMIDTQGARYGVTRMPRFSGPSCLTPGGARSWTDEIRSTAPAAWANLSMVTTHQYGGAAWNASNYQAIAGWLDGREFIVNEMHTQHRSVLNDPNRLPEDWVVDELEVALIFGRLFSLSVNNGANGWCYFLSNAPTANATSLIRTPWGGTPVRRKVYFAYRQLTSLQTFESSVVETTASNLPAGWHVIGFHKWGEDRVLLTVVAASDNTTPVTITVRDNAGAPVPVRRVIDRVTSATRDLETLADTTYPAPRTQVAIGVTRHSIRTLELFLRPDRGTGGEPFGRDLWLRASDNARYLEGGAVGENLTAQSADATTAATFRVVRSADSRFVLLAHRDSGRLLRVDLSSAAAPLRLDGERDEAATRFAWSSLGGRRFELRSAVNGAWVGVLAGPLGDALYANQAVSGPLTGLVYGEEGQAPAPASFEPRRGAGCGGSVGVPSVELRRGSLPITGSMLGVEFSGLPVGAPALGLLGVSDFPILDLGAFGAPGCVVGMQILATEGLVTTGSAAGWQLPVPNDAALAGSQALLQAVVLDRGANALGAIVSDKARAVVGG